MQVDEQLVDYLADLSCLFLADEEKQRITADLKEILAYMEQLGSLPADGVLERSHPFDYVNVFREDEAAASFDRELILRNAQERDEQMFIARRVIFPHLGT